MSDLHRFGVSAEDDLLQSFDALIQTQGYGNRSEALRDLMRDALVKSRLQNVTGAGEVLGSLTLVYDHHAKDLSDRMAEIQHASYELVVSSLHLHVSHDDCMEVIVLRGGLTAVRNLASGLLSLKGVTHGELFITVAGGEINSAHSTHAHPHK